jgi:anthranilate phosphoribosyltransferase
LQATGLGFVYTPEHFPETQPLVTYRREIGKRPPLATLELIWSPYAGEAHIVSGYVHPPTEGMIRGALTLHQIQRFTTVKGLEGSCDLPRERTGIIGVNRGDVFERLYLHPHEYDFSGKNVPLPTTSDSAIPAAELIHTVLHSHTLDAEPANDVMQVQQSIIWNSGFYLWHCGLAETLTTGIHLAMNLLKSGQAAAQLHQLQQALARHRAIKVGV